MSVDTASARRDIEGDGYAYTHADHGWAHSYLLPVVTRLLERAAPPSARVFDLGCGNGSTAQALFALGYTPVGIDASTSAIEQARRAYPRITFDTASAYDPLAETYGRFPVVISLEVIEHLFFPRKFAKSLFDLLEPGGTAIISTPFHGYWKNLALAVTGKLDAHFTALWDYGHIKFWSKRTLGQLLTESGLVNLSFHSAGRLEPLAKSMVVVCQRPRA